MRSMLTDLRSARDCCHVKYVAALDRSDHSDAITVHEISQNPVRALQHRRVKQVPIECLPSIRERIASITAAVGRQQEIRAVDVVVLDGDFWLWAWCRRVVHRQIQPELRDRVGGTCVAGRWRKTSERCRDLRRGVV